MRSSTTTLFGEAAMGLQASFESGTCLASLLGTCLASLLGAVLCEIFYRHTPSALLPSFPPPHATHYGFV